MDADNPALKSQRALTESGYLTEVLPMQDPKDGKAKYFRAYTGVLVHIFPDNGEDHLEAVMASPPRDGVGDDVFYRVSLPKELENTEEFRFRDSVFIPDDVQKRFDRMVQKTEDEYVQNYEDIKDTLSAEEREDYYLDNSVSFEKLPDKFSPYPGLPILAFGPQDLSRDESGWVKIDYPEFVTTFRALQNNEINLRRLGYFDDRIPPLTERMSEYYRKYQPVQRNPAEVARSDFENGHFLTSDYTVMDPNDGSEKEFEARSGVIVHTYPMTYDPDFPESAHRMDAIVASVPYADSDVQLFHVVLPSDLNNTENLNIHDMVWENESLSREIETLWEHVNDSDDFDDFFGDFPSAERYQYGDLPKTFQPFNGVPVIFMSPKGNREKDDSGYPYVNYPEFVTSFKNIDKVREAQAKEYGLQVAPLIDLTASITNDYDHAEEYVMDAVETYTQMSDAEMHDMLMEENVARKTDPEYPNVRYTTLFVDEDNTKLDKKGGIDWENAYDQDASMKTQSPQYNVNCLEEHQGKFRHVKLTLDEKGKEGIDKLFNAKKNVIKAFYKEEDRKQNDLKGYRFTLKPFRTDSFPLAQHIERKFEPESGDLIRGRVNAIYKAYARNWSKDENGKNHFEYVLNDKGEKIPEFDKDGLGRQKQVYTILMSPVGEDGHVLHPDGRKPNSMFIKMVGTPGFHIEKGDVLNINPDAAFKGKSTIIVRNPKIGIQRDQNPRHYMHTCEMTGTVRSITKETGDDNKIRYQMLLEDKSGDMQKITIPDGVYRTADPDALAPGSEIDVKAKQNEVFLSYKDQAGNYSETMKNYTREFLDRDNPYTVTYSDNIKPHDKTRDFTQSKDAGQDLSKDQSRGLDQFGRRKSGPTL